MAVKQLARIQIQPVLFVLVYVLQNARVNNNLFEMQDGIAFH